MTVFEEIKSMSIEDLAQEICQYFDMHDIECEKCPAYKFCYKGHNGMKNYLNSEVKDESRNID